MRESTKQMFRALLKDDSYTWDEVADLFVKECRKKNIKEFIYLMQERMKE